MQPKKQIRKDIQKKHILFRAYTITAVLSLVLFFVGGAFLSQTFRFVNKDTTIVTQIETIDVLRAFPVGVNPETKEIVENPNVNLFFVEHIGALPDASENHTSWIPHLVAKLALMDWYQNLASLTSRILVIQPGERKEQVAEHFKKILGWTNAEEQEFLKLVTGPAPSLEEGKFFPGTYTVPKGAKPEVVAPLVLDKFTEQIMNRYSDEVVQIVPLNDALTIASLLEREAYDFTDMRQISGIIWNRLFIDMRLQIDATLQYAKGTKPAEPWWPKVVPNDKYIASVYNTYKTEGLPPTPIANPSLDAILAALNPTKTDCMYYFHDRKAGFHCTETYEEHVALLKQYYGKGK